MSASATRGTFNVEVSRIGVSISPSSFTCVEPASLPKPLPTNTAPATFSRNLFREKVAGAVFVGNGFGKLMGSTQVNELGEIETPILLTSTLNVPRVADALLDYMLALPDGHRHDRVRIQGRDRYVVSAATEEPWRLHAGRPGTDKLRRCAANQR